MNICMRQFCIEWVPRELGRHLTAVNIVFWYKNVIGKLEDRKDRGYDSNYLE